MGARLAAVLVLSALAIGLTASPGAAHTITAETRFSRFKVPSGPQRAGDKAVVYGRLKAVDATCFSNLEVQLVRNLKSGAQKLLARDLTDAEGEYLFERRPRKKQTWVVVFPGFTFVDASHVHVCVGNTSKPIKVRVFR